MPAHRYLVTYGDGATVGMRNRQEVIEATSETQAYAAAKLRMRDGEFLRGVQQIEDEEGPVAPPPWRYMTEQEEREIYGATAQDTWG